jgi:N-acetylated-alpha-linked acidic dipeptidase
VEGPELYEAVLEEQEYDQVPTFHAYSGNGNVTGPVVYVNYGRISDFQSLQVRGVLFKDTIALIRNGKISRGMKVKMAEKFGCIGALLFSDPDQTGPSVFDEDEDSW